MEIEKPENSRLVSAMKGLENKGLMQTSEDSKTDESVIIVGKRI